MEVQTVRTEQGWRYIKYRQNRDGDTDRAGMEVQKGQRWKYRQYRDLGSDSTGMEVQSGQG